MVLPRLFAIRIAGDLSGRSESTTCDGMISAEAISNLKIMKTIIWKNLSVALVLSGAVTLAYADDTNMPPRTMIPLTPQQFVTDAAMGGMKEVRLSQLAFANSQNAEVRKFASRMVKDHSAANLKLAAIAQAKGLDFPPTNTFAADDPNWNNPMLTGSEQVKGAYLLTTNLPLAAYEDFRHLRSLSGKDFDRAYAGDMVMDHINTIIAFEAAKQGLSDPELRQFAAKTLPTLREHSQMAQKLAADITGAQTAGSDNPKGAAPASPMTATAGGM